MNKVEYVEIEDINESQLEHGKNYLVIDVSGDAHVAIWSAFNFVKVQEKATHLCSKIVLRLVKDVVRIAEI